MRDLQNIADPLEYINPDLRIRYQAPLRQQYRDEAGEEHPVEGTGATD